MMYQEGRSRLSHLREKITEIRGEMRALQADLQPHPVEDYLFDGADGEVRLSGLFGSKDDLFVIHNMGKGCDYCTMWADGYNGVYAYLASRAAFVVSSPDAPATQAAFAASRGWRFPMVSHARSSFARDMGYRDESGRCLPGVSVFRRDGGGIFRVSDTGLGPYDDFCSVWHFLDLLPGGANGWSPRQARS